MKDNLSIVILMIVFVMLVVMFPLYNFFERQDDMSYNLALRATTSFVEKVLNCGYMDSEMYDEFTTNLASTGNLYDIQIEAHIQTITKDPDNLNSDVYIVQERIEYNDQIFNYLDDADINSATLTQRDVKNGMYKLNIGDGFYVKLKNSNTTMAGALFNSIIATSSEERIVINYGGVVKNNAWYKIDANYEVAKETLTQPSVPTISPVTPTEKPENKPQVEVEKPHVHTAACYKSCKGRFSIIQTNKKLIHQCYNYKSGKNTDAEIIATVCPYVNEEGAYTITTIETKLCDRCRRGSINSKYRITCKCGFEEEIDGATACIFCSSQQYNFEMNMVDMRFETMKSHQTYQYNLYSNEEVLKCETCQATYTKLNSYKLYCHGCENIYSGNEEIQGVNTHNKIKICGYE